MGVIPAHSCRHCQVGQAGAEQLPRTFKMKVVSRRIERKPLKVCFSPGDFFWWSQLWCRQHETPCTHCGACFFCCLNRTLCVTVYHNHCSACCSDPSRQFLKLQYFQSTRPTAFATISQMQWAVDFFAGLQQIPWTISFCRWSTHGATSGAVGRDHSHSCGVDSRKHHMQKWKLFSFNSTQLTESGPTVNVPAAALSIISRISASLCAKQALCCVSIGIVVEMLTWTCCSRSNSPNQSNRTRNEYYSWISFNLFLCPSGLPKMNLHQSLKTLLRWESWKASRVRD